MSLGARDYCAVLSRFATVISLAASACLAATDATAQWYVGVDIGGNASRDIVVKSRSNDRPSICKEYINPRALSVADCTTPGRGAGDGWLAPFDPDAGFFGEAELGCHLSPRWRLAAVYARSPADFNQTVSSTDATGADFDKIRSSLSGSARARARSGRGTLRPPWPATRTWTRSRPPTQSASTSRCACRTAGSRGSATGSRRNSRITATRSRCTSCTTTSA